MPDIQTISLGDQLVTAMQEVVREKGYQITIDLEHKPEGMSEDDIGYGMQIQSPVPIELSDGFLESLLVEAVKKIGGAVIDEG